MENKILLDHMVHMDGTFDVEDQGSGTYTILKIPPKKQIIVGKATLKPVGSSYESCSFTIPVAYAFSIYSYWSIVQPNRNAAQILQLEANANIYKPSYSSVNYLNWIQIWCETMNGSDITVSLPVYFMILGYAYTA